MSLVIAPMASTGMVLLAVYHMLCNRDDRDREARGKAMFSLGKTIIIIGTLIFFLSNFIPGRTGTTVQTVGVIICILGIGLVFLNFSRGRR